MNYLLNNIEVEIDIDLSEDFQHSIYFKVHNRTLQTYWLVDHRVEEIKNFICEKFHTEMPDEVSERFYWLQDICTTINNSQKNDEDVLDFFKSKPSLIKRKVSKKRSLSTFSQLLKMSCTEEIRTHSRNTVTSRQKQYAQIILENSSRFSDLKTTRDYIEFLTLLNYKEIRKVGSGTQSQAFKALNQHGHLVAVKISQNTQENLYAALMQRQINQDVADNFVGNYLFQYQILEVEDILIVEEELAQNTLEDMIIKKQQSNENFDEDQINRIMKDVVDQLFNLHIGRQSVHNDIKPENILIQDGKFILHDFGAIRQVPKVEEQVEINQILGTVLYMSPLKFQHFLQSDQKQLDVSITQSILTISNNFKHNPFKSDIYSLGLVLMRLLLHNDQKILNNQIEYIFYEHRDQELPKFIERFEYYIYPEKLFLFKTLKKIKPLLKLLLETDEKQRISTIELAALFNSQICSSIQTSFTQQFVPSMWKTEAGNYQLAYSLKQQIYEGNYQEDTQERDGYGEMYKAPKNELIFKIQKHKKEKKSICDEDNEFDESSITQLQESKQHYHAKQSLASIQNQLMILYKGEWQKNLPHGKGQLHLYNTVNDLNYKEINMNVGKVINKVDDHHEEHSLEITSHFFYGLLNSTTTINGNTQEYFFNLSESIMTSKFKVQQCYYKFYQEKSGNKIYGYEQPFDYTVIDLLNIDDKEVICVIIRSFIENLEQKITHFEIRRNVIEKQILLFEQNHQRIYIRFDGRTKRENEQKKLIQQEQPLQKKETTSCCVGTKKKKQQTAISEIEIHSDMLESKIVQECLCSQKSYLSELLLQHNSLSSNALDWLFSDNTISQIVTLSFSNSLIQDQQLSQILLSQSVTMVKDLDLSNTQISIKTITALINSENLNQLLKLRISNCPQCRQFEDFIQCDKSQKLILLDISQNKWVNWDLLKFFSIEHLPNLNQLNISNTSLSEKEISKFLKTPFGKKLNLIQTNVKDTNVQDFKITIRQENSIFEHIRFLEKYGYMSQKDQEDNNILRDETLKRISYSQGLQNIEYLNLRGQTITHNGMKYFLQSQFITNIISINLSETSINGDVLKYINQSKIQHLKILKLKKCDFIDFHDLQSFLKNYRSAQLTTFYISSRQIQTKKLITELKSLGQLVNTQIIFNHQEKQQDLSILIQVILTWVAVKIKQQKLNKFTLDLCDCKQIQDGFDTFLEELKELQATCRLKFKITNSSLPLEIKRQLEQLYKPIKFVS